VILLRHLQNILSFYYSIYGNVIPSSKSVRPDGILIFVGSEVLTAVVIDATILWDIVSCSPYVNRRFGGKYHLHLQGRKSVEQEISKEQNPDTYLRNVGSHTNYTALYTRTWQQSHLVFV
jgi:hypothetical protein